MSKSSSVDEFNFLHTPDSIGSLASDFLCSSPLPSNSSTWENYQFKEGSPVGNITIGNYTVAFFPFYRDGGRTLCWGLISPHSDFLNSFNDLISRDRVICEATGDQQLQFSPIRMYLERLSSMGCHSVAIQSVGDVIWLNLSSSLDLDSDVPSNRFHDSLSLTKSEELPETTNHGAILAEPASRGSSDQSFLARWIAIWEKQFVSLGGHSSRRTERRLKDGIRVANSSDFSKNSTFLDTSTRLDRGFDILDKKEPWLKYRYRRHKHAFQLYRDINPDALDQLSFLEETEHGLLSQLFDVDASSVLKQSFLLPQDDSNCSSNWIADDKVHQSNTTCFAFNSSQECMHEGNTSARELSDGDLGRGENLFASVLRALDYFMSWTSGSNSKSRLATSDSESWINSSVSYSPSGNRTEGILADGIFCGLDGGFRGDIILGAEDGLVPRERLSFHSDDGWSSNTSPGLVHDSGYLETSNQRPSLPGDAPSKIEETEVEREHPLGVCPLYEFGFHAHSVKRGSPQDSSSDFPDDRAEKIEDSYAQSHLSAYQENRIVCPINEDNENLVQGDSCDVAMANYFRNRRAPLADKDSPCRKIVGYEDRPKHSLTETNHESLRGSRWMQDNEPESICPSPAASFKESVDGGSATCTYGFLKTYTTVGFIEGAARRAGKSPVSEIGQYPSLGHQISSKIPAELNAAGYFFLVLFLLSALLVFCSTPRHPRRHKTAQNPRESEEMVEDPPSPSSLAPYTYNADDLAEVSGMDQTADREFAATSPFCPKMPRTTEMFKITLNYLQTLSLASAVDFNWSPLLLSALHTTGLVSGTFISGSASESYLPTWHFQTPISLPEAVVRLAIMETAVSAVMGVWYVVWAIRSYQLQETKRYLARMCVVSTCAVHYVAYAIVTHTALSLLAWTEEFDKSTTSSHAAWNNSPDIEPESNNGEAHVLMARVLAWAVFLSFTSNVPICTVVAFNRDQGEDRNWVSEFIPFLHRGHSDQFDWWELVVVLRKAALAVVIVLGSRRISSNVIGVICICVLMTALNSQNTFKPYQGEYDELNKFEGISLFAVAMTFALGLILNEGEFSFGYQVLLSAAIFGLNFGILVWFLVMLIRYSIDEFRFRDQSG